MASKAWKLVETEIDNGNIQEWVQTMTEEQIALSCGISYSSFQNFKKKYPKLENALVEGKKRLCSDLKSDLIKKARGYDYEETTTHITKNPDGTEKKDIKKFKKHCPPDTGAIHLLLKNNDNTWHNDDDVILKMKREELELKKQLNQKEEQIIQLTSSLNDLLNMVGSDDNE